jgi:hypothetical protein
MIDWQAILIRILSGLCCLSVVIGLAIAAVFAMAAEARGRPKYINCPDCLDSVLIDAETCPHCGRKMK